MNKKITNMLLVALFFMIGTLSYGAKNDASSDSTTTCTANFSYYVQNGTVTFLDSSKTASSISSWHWDFGDGTFSSLKNPTHTYASTISVASVCEYITTNTGCTSTSCKTVKVRDVVSNNCIANFSYKVQNRNVTFLDSSMVDTVVYRTWNFGDGTYSSSKNPTHTYSGNTEFFNVSLTIRTKTDSCTAWKQIYVPSSVTNTPTADFTYVLVSDSTVSSKTYRFYDRSTSPSGIASRKWTMPDSTIITDSTFVFTFDKNLANATVCLTIWDKSSYQASVCKTIVLKDTIPSSSCFANFMYSVNNHTVSFVDSSSASSSIISWLWNLGDSATSTSKNPVHTYSSNLSSVNVCMTIYSATACQSSVCKTIILNDSIPVVTCKASFGYSKDSTVTSGAKYYFYNYSSSSDSLTYVWNFGDGLYSTLKNPTHTFNLTPGSQVWVGLFIKSSKGCSDSTFLKITIPMDSLNHTIAGLVKGNDELLPSGIILLYKKGTKNFSLQKYQVISDGAFKFDNLNQGSYILYAIPGISYLSKYLPTYYVNKLSWSEANIINLQSSVLGLTLQLQPTKLILKGLGKITGTINNVQSITATEQAVLKSASAQVLPSAILYTQFGTALYSASPDASGNFEFQDLPFGNYVLQVEYPNLDSKALSISLSNESPEMTNLNFTINNDATGVNILTSNGDMTILYVSSDQISIRVMEGGKYKISLTNMSGETLIGAETTLNANADNLFNVGSLAKGVYILKLQNNSTTMVKKILR